MKSRWVVAIVIFLVTWSGFSQNESRQGDRITLIQIEGVISPVTVNYLQRGVKSALQNDNGLLLIEMDTPGGLLESTKDLVQEILGAEELPIVVYITPKGASAASAGTFITLAADVAAMAPATNIGAASPVQMGGGQEVKTDSVMRKKIFNHTESYIKSIAEQKGRNVAWAISAVRDGKSLTASEALELNVVDLLAEDRQDLLKKLEGREVKNRILKTAHAVVETLQPNTAERWLSILIRPEVVLILTMIAIFGIVGEVTNPGALVPGIGGLISLVLVLYASAVIPINSAGFLLIALAVILFVVEAFTTSFGLLTTGGAISFLLGGLMLFQDLPEPMGISWSWLIPTTAVMVLFFIWVAYKGLRIQSKSTSTGKRGLVGKRVEVIEEVGPLGGRVFVSGEYWNAFSEESIQVGEPAVIVEVDRLRLRIVKPETFAKEKESLNKKNKN